MYLDTDAGTESILAIDTVLGLECNVWTTLNVMEVRRHS